ncbi:ABC transporter ATP-binding protein [uncultured Sphaerochaeta sp.]|uniref:ABC transporter ATP-binding protein n=1 Tax=uncultured Sphaerochaeta sp. TaxID=886478 RepID=UPI002A0A66E0|nr:ABC transporter ATP-binding protein [uncultured Sphaerochaeta sp.]
MKPSLVKNAILEVCRTKKGSCLILFFAVTGTVLASLAPPQILKLVIDKNLVPKVPQGLLSLSLFYLGALFCIGLFDFIKEVIIAILGQSIIKEIRSKMMVKLQTLPARYFSFQDSGVIVSRFTNDVDSVNAMFSSGIVGLAIDCFKIVGIVISIWLFSSRLGLIVLSLLPVIFVISRLFQKSMLKAQLDNRRVIGMVNNHIAESIKNMLMIKSNSKERYMEDTYVKYLQKNFKTIDKVNFFDSIFPPIIQMIRALVIALIVVLSSKELNFLGITLGMVAASIDLVSNLFVPIENLGMELQNIQTSISGIHRIDEFCREEEDDSKDSNLTAKSILPQSNSANLVFDHVSFQYDKGVEILKDISLKVGEQEKVTLVGRTGVGKSTLFKLVLGLLKPTAGTITINGVDVYAIPNSEKRKIFGYVDQGFQIIPGTVGEQISLKDPAITKNQIEKALEIVDLQKYVESLDKGIDTLVTDNTLFSQGQKQLLAIARAIVMAPPILLLDEITANLDSATEAKLTSVLQKTSQAHTVLSISHRLSSMIDCDTMVILEKGKIKNSGSPEKLLKEDDWVRSHRELERFTRG